MAGALIKFNRSQDLRSPRAAGRHAPFPFLELAEASRFRLAEAQGRHHSSPGYKHRTLLAERQYGRCFVVLHIEEGVELRDLQQVVYSLGDVEQLEFAALVLGSG